MKNSLLAMGYLPLALFTEGFHAFIAHICNVIHIHLMGYFSRIKNYRTGKQIDDRKFA